jgi:hypothetical protein
MTTWSKSLLIAVLAVHMPVTGAAAQREPAVQYFQPVETKTYRYNIWLTPVNTPSPAPPQDAPPARALVPPLPNTREETDAIIRLKQRLSTQRETIAKLERLIADHAQTIKTLERALAKQEQRCAQRDARLLAEFKARLADRDQTIADLTLALSRQNEQQTSQIASPPAQEPALPEQLADVVEPLPTRLPDQPPPAAKQILAIEDVQQGLTTDQEEEIAQQYQQTIAALEQKIAEQEQTIAEQKRSLEKQEQRLNNQIERIVEQAATLSQKDQELEQFSAFLNEQGLALPTPTPTPTPKPTPTPTPRPSPTPRPTPRPRATPTPTKPPQKINMQQNNKTDMDALTIMEKVFVGNYTKFLIKSRLDKVLKLYDLPINEDYYHRFGSALVALRKDSGVPEMDILYCMIRTYTTEMNFDFAESAAMCTLILKNSR